MERLGLRVKAPTRLANEGMSFDRLTNRVYGVWFMVYGLWFMVYGLWFMVYGLGCRV